MLKKYDSNTGKYLKALIEEKDEKYVIITSYDCMIMKDFYGDRKKTDLMIIFICIIKMENYLETLLKNIIVKFLGLKVIIYFQLIQMMD